MKAFGELGISPTPWNDGGFGVPKALSDANGEIIVTVDATKNMDANARLIAAAPELYECLRDAVEDMEEINCDPDGCSSCLLRDDCKIQNYRYVLAKASGEEVAKAVKESEASAHFRGGAKKEGEANG